MEARRSHVSGCDRRKGRKDDDMAGKCVALAVSGDIPTRRLPESRRQGARRVGGHRGRTAQGRARDGLKHSPGAVG